MPIDPSDIAAVHDELSRHPLRAGMDAALFDFAAGRIEALREGDTAGFEDLVVAVRSTYGDDGMHADGPLGDVAAALVLLWGATYELTDRPVDDLLLARRICTTVYLSAADALVRARAVTTLSDVAQRLLDRTGDVAVLREAAAHLQDALTDVGADVPEARPFLAIGMAGVQEELADRSGAGPELDEAIDFAEEAVRTAPDDDVRTVFEGTLVVLHLRRFHFLRAPADVHRALELARAALRATPLGHQEWPNRANRLVGALIESFNLSEDQAALLEADELVRRAGPRVPPGSPLHATLAVNAATVQRLSGEQDPQRLDDTIERLRTLLGHTAEGSSAHLACRMALGDALAFRWEVAESTDDLRESLQLAVLAAESAGDLDVAREVASLEAAAARARRLVELVQPPERHALLERTAASSVAMVDRVLELLRGRREMHGERWLRNVFGAGTTAAEAYAQLGRQEDALRALLHGREIRRRLLPRYATSTPDAGRGVERAPVVHVAAANLTGLAVIDDGTRVETLWLPELTVDAATRQADAFYSALDGCRRGQSRGFDAMRTVLSWLWRASMGPVAASLAQRAVTEACLAPYGLLQLLPLHAACWRDPRADGPWRYLGDEVSCTYFSSAAGDLGHGRGEGVGALVVGEPATAAHVETLPGANHEAAKIAELTGTRVVPPTAATAGRVASALERATYFHFAGHAEATAPLRSDAPVTDRKGCLILAGGDRLWDVDIARLQLGGLSLVALSACQTGRVDAGLPDEGLSLGNAFLDAGASAVVSSLWAVPDASTAALMVEFAARWIGAGLPARQALHEAQLAIRRYDRGDVAAGTWRDAGARVVRALRPERGGGPFEHPYHWAAFVVHGASGARWTGGVERSG